MEQTYEVETIEKARWTNGEWEYYVKWDKYEQKHNTWEPGSSLLACDWTLSGFWKDVGHHHLGRSNLREEYTVLSSPEFKVLCKERITGEIEMEDADAEDQKSGTYITDKGCEIVVVHPCMLWIDPECLGLKGLSENDRYQVVKLALQSDGIDASETLYKKAKKDTKEDPGWLEGWDSGCVVCYEKKSSLAMLSCNCRFQAYCIDCLRQINPDPEKPTKKGQISCPTCRGGVYIVSRSWIMRTSQEEEHRKEKRKQESKDHFFLKKLLLKRGNSGANSTSHTLSGSTPVRLRLNVARDRSCQILMNIATLARSSPHLYNGDLVQVGISSYRARYPSSDATEEEIVKYLGKCKSILEAESQLHMTKE